MASKTSGTPRKPRPSELMAVELRDLQIAVGILSSEIDELKSATAGLRDSLHTGLAYNRDRRRSQANRQEHLERVINAVEKSRMDSVHILHERITKTQSASIGWQLRRFGLWLTRRFS